MINFFDVQISKGKMIKRAVHFISMHITSKTQFASVHCV
jgi:hypothetical protein